ncbi:hypothetical protein ACOMHN_049675 [Nucella lapillus]
MYMRCMHVFYVSQTGSCCELAMGWREHLSAEVAALAAPKESLYTEVADFGALCYQSSGGGSLAAAFFALVFSLRNDRAWVSVKRDVLRRVPMPKTRRMNI